MSGEGFWRRSYDPGLVDLSEDQLEMSILDAIRPTFQDFPGKAALEFYGVEIPFGQLDRMANQFASVLISHGFSPGDIVGIDLPNCPQYVIAWLGALRAGCVVSGVSPLLSTEEMEHQLRDLGSGERRVGIVLLDALYQRRLTEFVDRLPRLDLIIVTNVVDMLPSVKQALAKALGKVPKGKVRPIPGRKVVRFKQVLRSPGTEAPKVTIAPDDLAFIQYTGGTTGAPKGAMLTHRNVVSDILIVQRWLDWTDARGQRTALSGFPFFHIAGLFLCINCIFLGWTQILVPNPRDTDFICDRIERFRPNYLVNVPSLFQMLLKNPRFPGLDHSQLKMCLSSAAPFPKESQEELESIVGEGLLLECYGMTETSPLTTMNPSKGDKKLGSIGLPLLNTDIKLLHTTSGAVATVGEPGEICVRGPMVMKGYFNKPEETRNAIDADGYMHTGDVAIFDEDGYLTIVDRTKDMINVSGFKVYSTATEERLSRHPAIDMIAIVGVADPDRPGSEMVKAFVTLDPGHPFDGDDEALKADIVAFGKEKCAPYEVPKLIEIREDLPLTAAGKINKVELRKS